MSIDLEIFGFFADEAADSLEKLEAECIVLMDDPRRGDEIESIFRTLHNLKGTSKAIGLEQYGNFIHEVEDYFLPFKAGEKTLSRPVVSLLLEVQKTLYDWIAAIRASDGERLDYEIADLLERIHGSGSEASAPVSVTQAAAASTTSQGDELEALFDALSNTGPGTSESAPLPEEGDLEALFDAVAAKEAKSPVADAAQGGQADEPEPVSIAERQVQATASVPAKTEAKADTRRGRPSAGANESVRVATTKIDDLLQNIAELTISSTMIEDAFERGENVRLGTLLERHKKMLKNVQGKSFELRMNNLSALFQRIQRAAVQIAGKQDKDIEFDISGNDVELDRSVIDLVGEALTHVIRNAVDHGIEDRAARSVTDKPARARITISATQEADSVQIKICDDGKGMAPAKLKAKAVEKGLISEAQSEDMTDAEAYQLIFHSGFSTAEEVTDVSGRGVGMSAVKDTVENISGEIEIESMVGRGTAFTVTLPTTVSIIDGVATRLFDQNLIVPIRKIKEIVSAGELNIQQQFTGSCVANFRGRNLNIQYLDKVIAGRSCEENAVCFIVEKAGQLLGLVSPASLRMTQVVVKGAGAKLAEFPYFNGVTILGNGEPAFIVDLFKIHDDFFQGAERWLKAS